MDTISEYSRLKKCKKKAEEKNDLKELASICNALGELLSQYGYHKEAIAEHEMEKQVSELLQDKIGEAVASRKIGECLCKLGQFDQALQFQKHYLSLAQKCNDQVEVQRALATLGDTYYNQADAQGMDSSRPLLDQAEKKFLQALRVCSELRVSSTLTESEYMAMKGRLLLNLGLVYDVRGAEKESTEYLQKALTIAKQWHLEEEEYLCHFNWANQALRHGQPATAQISLQEALKLATRLHNKPRQKEVYCQLAIASVTAGDTKSAKHFLKKAYKLLPTADKSHKLTNLYKAVSVVEALSEQCSASRQDDSVMFDIHEKLGDAFTEIGMYCGSYATAIQHYQMMVESGERLGLGADKLIPAYVSLAQTYADNRQPDLAIESYNKELQLRGDDHEQICRTLLNIAELEERKGSDYKVLSKTYMSAYSHAKKASDPRLQAQVLQSLILTQEAFKEQRHKEQTLAKLRQVQAKHGLNGQSEEEDSQPQDSDDTALAESTDHDTDLSISDLTNSDKSDEENVRPVVSQPVGSSRVRRMKTFKKNEKGETPLHVACINGNLKKVKILLAEGHPVNVRDHCGWTPLHEAANHNYPAVVEVLLNAGADINDRGGAECSGFTPLIDAAACGNLDIVRMLIEKGANVLAKNDKGCTALQALRDWHRDYADTSDQELMAQYNIVVHMFQEKVSGSKAPSSNEVAMHSPGGSLHQPGSSHTDSGSTSVRQSSPNAVNSKRHLPSRGTSRQPISYAAAKKGLPGDSASSDEDEIYRNPQLEDLSTSPQSATETYRTSILALGSSMQRAEVRASLSKPAVRSQRNTHRPALIDEREVVGDDWLIDDLQPVSRKRRDQSSLGGILFSDSIRTAGQSKRARLSGKGDSTVAKADRHVVVQTDEADDNESWLSLSPQDLHQDNRLLSPHKDLSHHSRLSSSKKLANSSVNRVVHTSSDLSSGEEEPLPVLSHCFRRTDTLAHSATNDLAGKGEEGLERLSGHHQETRDASLSESQPVARIESHVFHVSPLHAVVAASLSRVRVRIEGSVFLIPLPATEKTVGWLSEEASLRYSSHFGRRPLLTLSNIDGAILSPDDILSAVLCTDEQLDATVHGWDQPALSERYAQACKTLSMVKYRNISGILREAENSSQLSLSGLGLRSSVLLPITRALRGETSLTHLLLPDNHLGDNGMQVLAESLEDMKNLTWLSLSGNDITAAGLKHLADLFLATRKCESANSSSAPLQKLQTLDLSHNPLGDSIADSLCHVVRGLPSLTALLMSSCGLTAKLFQHNRPALASCFQDRNLEQLDVSHNLLGTLGVELLLWSLNTQRLTSLDLGHTCCDSNTSGHLAFHLKVFVNQDCALQSLSLENCSLHREDVEFVCRLPSEVSSLQKLNISVNKAVTRDSLQKLLHNAAQCSYSRLHHLQAQSCSVTSPLSATPSFPSIHPSTSSFPSVDTPVPVTTTTPSFLETLKIQLSSCHPLQYLSLPCGGLDKADQDCLRQVWTQQWEQANVEVTAHSMVLSLKQS